MDRKIRWGPVPGGSLFQDRSLIESKSVLRGGSRIVGISKSMRSRFTNDEGESNDQYRVIMINPRNHNSFHNIIDPLNGWFSDYVIRLDTLTESRRGNRTFDPEFSLDH